MSERKLNFREECHEHKLDLEDWKIYYFISNDEKFVDTWGTFYIINKTLSTNDKLPSLVVIPGFSMRSFCETTKRIINNLEKIKITFKDVWVLAFNEQVKKLQKKACDDRDETGSYDAEISFNQDLGVIVDKLLKATKIENIHLLGKSAGGAVAICAFTENYNYKALYLAVPASPNNVENLLEKEWHNKIFIFGWDQRDIYKFNWGFSNEEKIKYDKTMKKIKEISNDNIIESEQFNKTSTITDVTKYHEIPDDLFDLINEKN
jgi:hypothetical protein